MQLETNTEMDIQNIYYLEQELLVLFKKKNPNCIVKTKAKQRFNLLLKVLKMDLKDRHKTIWETKISLKREKNCLKKASIGE